MRRVTVVAAVGVALIAAVAAPILPVGAQTVAFRPAGVTFRQDAAVLAGTGGTIPWRTAVNAPQSAGGRRRFEGALLGTVLGAVAGWVIGSAACDRCDDPAPMMAIAGLGAVGGGVLGALIGLPPVAHRAPAARLERAVSSARLLPNVALQLTGPHASWWSAWGARVAERTFVSRVGPSPRS